MSDQSGHTRIRRWTVVKVGHGERRYWIKLTPSGSYGPEEEPPRVGETLVPVERRPKARS